MVAFIRRSQAQSPNSNNGSGSRCFCAEDGQVAEGCPQTRPGEGCHSPLPAAFPFVRCPEDSLRGVPLPPAVLVAQQLRRGRGDPCVVALSDGNWNLNGTATPQVWRSRGASPAERTRNGDPAACRGASSSASCFTSCLHVEVCSEQDARRVRASVGRGSTHFS